MPAQKNRRRAEKQYKNLAQKGVDGDFSDLIDPLDYLILEKLPEQGETAFGLYPQGESTQNLARTAFKPLTPTQIAMRLRIMDQLNLVVRVTMLSRSKEGWQRTAAGKKLYQDWKKTKEEATK